MAPFNPTPPEATPQDMSRNSGGPIVRRTLGTLFEGIGNVGVAAATAFDFRNQWNLREDIRTGVEIVRDQYGVNAGADTAGGSLFDYSTSPEGLQQANEEVDRLTQAYQNGTLRESYYYAQLNSLVRSVKTRYPGYEDQIDATIADITGIDPANAYISQLRQEAMADAGATNSMQDGLEDYIKTYYAELGVLEPGFHDLPWDQQLALVTPGQSGNLRSRVAEFGGAQARLDLINNELEMNEISVTAALEETVAEGQSLYLSNLNLGIEEGTLVNPDQIVRDLIARGETLADGTLVSDVGSAVRYMQGLLVQQRGNLERILTDPRFAGADPTRAREMINDYVGTLEFYIDTLMNGETGMAALAQNLATLNNTRAYAAVDEAFGGALTYLTVIQESVPQAFMDHIAMRNLEPLAEFSASLVQAVLTRSALQANPALLGVFEQAGVTIPPGATPTFGDVAQLTRNLADSPEEAAEAVQAAMNMQLDIIRGTNGITASQEQVVSAMTFLFGAEGGFNFSLIPVDEHQDMYELLTSPLIAQAAVAAGPEIQTAYENWAIDSFRDINFQTISDLNNNLLIPGFTDTFTLAFNQATGQLEVRPNEGVEFRIGRGMADTFENPGSRFYAAYVGLQDNVDKLNQSLSGINHLFTAGGGTMGAPEFTGLLPAQLNVPVQFVTEPTGLGGLTPLESPITTDPTRPTHDAEGTPIPGTTIPGGAPETQDGRRAPALDPGNPNPMVADPNPNENPRNLGTTFPGGAEGTPDGQAAPALGTRPATNTPGGIFGGNAQPNLGGLAGVGTPQGAAGAVAEGIDVFTPGEPAPTTVTDPNNPYATMGWDEINQLDAYLLSPDARAQLQQRVTELIAQGNTAEVKNLSAESAKNISREFRNMAEKEDDAELNSRYAAISTILLEPSPELRQLRMDNYENTVVTDSTSFLLGRLAPGHGDDHILEMQPVLQTNLTNFFQAAPPDIAEGLGILSGYRSVERQRELWEDALRRYGSAEVARRWVAPPGNSQHNHGNAADLTWNGQSLAHAPAWVVQWLHANAEAYGLVFPLSNENWHVELIGARG